MGIDPFLRKGNRSWSLQIVRIPVVVYIDKAVTEMNDFLPLDPTSRRVGDEHALCLPDPRPTKNWG